MEIKMLPRWMCVRVMYANAFACFFASMSMLLLALLNILPGSVNVYGLFSAGITGTAILGVAAFGLHSIYRFLFSRWSA